MFSDDDIAKLALLQKKQDRSAVGGFLANLYITRIILKLIFIGIPLFLILVFIGYCIFSNVQDEKKAAHHHHHSTTVEQTFNDSAITSTPTVRPEQSVQPEPSKNDSTDKTNLLRDMSP